MSIPRRLRRVQVEPGARAEIVRVVLPRQIKATRRCVRRDQRSAIHCACTLSICFLHDILIGARQSRKVVECGRRVSPRQRLARNEHTEAHVRPRAIGGMRALVQLPAETVPPLQDLDAPPCQRHRDTTAAAPDAARFDAAGEMSSGKYGNVISRPSPADETPPPPLSRRSRLLAPSSPEPEDSSGS